MYPSHTSLCAELTQISFICDSNRQFILQYDVLHRSHPDATLGQLNENHIELKSHATCAKFIHLHKNSNAMFDSD